MNQSPKNIILIIVILFLLVALGAGIYVALRPQLVQKQAAGETCTLEAASCEWDAVPGATAYQYQLYAAGAPVQSKSGIVDASVTKVTFTPQLGVQYKCEVAPINACGAGPISLTLGAPGAPPPGPSGGVCPTEPPVTPTPVPPTPTPTVGPTATPTPLPSGATPTPTPTNAPSATPTPAPSGSGTPVPTATPTPGPNDPTVDIKANGSDGPITINRGTSAMLTWTSANASSCTASNAWSGGKATNGNETIDSVNQNSTFTITCNGAVDSVTVNVQDPGSQGGTTRGGGTKAGVAVANGTPQPTTQAKLANSASTTPTILGVLAAIGMVVAGGFLLGRTKSSSR